MSKCLKCGASLPPVGECPTCAAASQPAGRPVPSLLDKDIHIDRRRPDRDASAPAAPATPPGMMARTPVPPGMTPAQATPRAPGLPVMPPRPPAPAAHAPQAPAMPSAHALRPQPAPAPAPVPVQAATPRHPPPAPVPPRAPAFNLPGVAAPAPRTNTATFGAPAMTPVPPAPPPAAALDLAAEEDEAFPVDVEETEQVETLAPPPSRLPNVPAPVRAPAPPPPAPVARVAPTPKTAPTPKAAPAPDVLEVHARPASLWRRLLAFTIDTGTIAAVAALYLMLASSVAGVQTPQTGLSGLDALVIQVRALQSVLVPGAVLVLLLSLVYCAVSAFLWNGRTLGRRLLGLRLVDTHGLAPAPGRAVVRAVLATLSFGLFLAGFWMALFDRRGQTLHDKLTSTYVVQPS